MIKTQKEYNEYLEAVIVLLKQLDINTDDLQVLKNRINKTELIVPVVGGFSAGKSTLINSFLGVDVLPTDITPETALATELRYSDEDYIEAIKDDNSFEKFTLAQIEDIKKHASQYQYLKLYLNNKKLQTIEPLVLVDMPGFDAPIKRHNQAILNYLTKGIYFIVLTSIEDGTLTQSTQRELDNMTEFGKEFSFCLSKSDLKSENDVRNVQQEIEEQLKDYFDFQQGIIPLYQNGGSELEKILTSIDAEKLFEKVFKDDLKYNYLEVESSINTIISTLKTSKEDIHAMLEELRSGIEKIINKKENMIEEAQSKYSDTSVEAIINSVAKDIMSQQDSLVQLAISNTSTEERFQQKLNEIVRHSLISRVKAKLREASDNIVDDFSIELKDLAINTPSFELGDNWVHTISESTKTLLTNAQNGLTDLVASRKKNQTDSTDKIYKVITSALAITTNVINPLLELFIVFVPEILSWFGAKSKEERMKKEMYNKFQTEIIPPIKAKLREELPSLFSNQLNNTIEIISERFEAQLKQKEEEISKAQKEKEQDVQAIEDKLLVNENIKEQIKTLTNNILYKRG